MDIFGPIRQRRRQRPNGLSGGLNQNSPDAQQPRLTQRMARAVDRLSAAGRNELRQANGSSKNLLKPAQGTEGTEGTQGGGAQRLPAQIGTRCGLQPGASLKRAMDIAIAASMLLLLAPIIVMVAVLVRVSMGRGILFSQPRVGLHGRPFDCLKFRTMIPGAEAALEAYLQSNPAARREWDASRKLQHDPRITSIGRFLRRSSLDELPQLLNVLRGDMSCVGPRPVVQAELPRYGVHMADYLSVRPGLTGLWQVSGRSHLSYDDRVALDADYIKHWTLMRDVVILFKTIPAVAKFQEAA